MDFVEEYLNLIIEVSNDCKNEKRTLRESILLINKFSKSLENFIEPKYCSECKKSFNINWNTEENICPKCVKS